MRLRLCSYALFFALILSQTITAQRPGSTGGGGGLSGQRNSGGSQTNNPSQRKNNDQEAAVELHTQLIEVRAVVTDKKGQIIDGLSKESFEVTENDKPQQLSF